MLVVDGPGPYDLADFGHRTPIVLTERKRKSQFFPFRITEEAHRKYPYARVLLRFRMEVGKGTKAGAAHVYMRTGHGSSALAEFISERKDGRLNIEWATVDVEGQTTRHTSRRSIDVNYPNYMLFDDATAGKHRFRFKIDRYHGFRVKRVTISPESGIALTAKSPYGPDLTIAARKVSAGPPRTGRPMTVALRVTNRSAEPATDVPVNLTPDRGLRVVGAEARRRWRRIAPGATAERRLQVVPLSSGRHTLRVFAGSGRRARSGDLVFSTAAPDSSSSAGGTPVWVWIALGAAVAGVAVWRVRAPAA